MSELATRAQNPPGILDSNQARHLMILSGRAVEGEGGALELTGKLDCIGSSILKIVEGDEPQSLYEVYLQTAHDPYLNETTLIELADYGTESHDRSLVEGQPETQS